MRKSHRIRFSKLLFVVFLCSLHSHHLFALIPDSIYHHNNNHHHNHSHQHSPHHRHRRHHQNRETFKENELSSDEILVASTSTIATFAVSLPAAVKSRSNIINSRNINKRPTFLNCESFASKIKEEEPRDTFVVKVVAIDEDAIDNGGNVTYKLLERENGANSFKIDSVTGEIRTKIKFDYDVDDTNSTLFIKKKYLTVKATDDGHPKLSDVCTFLVEIVDINDNIPIFNEDRKEVILALDAAEKQAVTQISAIDIDDGNNSVIFYSFLEKSAYFSIGEQTGIVEVSAYGERALREGSGGGLKVGDIIALNITAYNPGLESRYSVQQLVIEIVDSRLRAPTFLDDYPATIELFENFTNTGSRISSRPIRAVSNMDSPELAYRLIVGKTKQTNKGSTFRIETENNMAFIVLSKLLDYERIKKYTVTVNVTNIAKISSTIDIDVIIKDVNDNAPSFIAEDSSVLENQEPGTFVMQIKAEDEDETPEFQEVRYFITNSTNLFSIFANGTILTAAKFDRETKAAYVIKVIAENIAIGDNNKIKSYEQGIIINIGDVNDQAPVFGDQFFNAIQSIKEDAKTHTVVMQVKAFDNDLKSEIIYSIVDGNDDESFQIDSYSGEITVNKKLDYEKIKNYTLTIMASDGLYNATTQVQIIIDNVNDNKPEFNKDFPTNITIEEGKLYTDCLVNITAYDPDDLIKGPVEISLDDATKLEDKFELINGTGCLRIKKELDRDLPNGSEVQQCVITAFDGQTNAIHITFMLTDINDNAPMLKTKSVVWFENEAVTSAMGAEIVKLIATDYDSEKNGPPFSFKLLNYANLFEIREDRLYALVEFDREQKKFYDLEIEISDSGQPTMSAVSKLHVVIGDRNDNPIKNGKSFITVYKFQSNLDVFDIGRAFVEDEDDWESTGKVFLFSESNAHFLIDRDSGLISMKNSTPEGTHTLFFNVTDTTFQNYNNTATAIVVVHVKNLPTEAIDLSSSIRFLGLDAKDFIEKEISKKDILGKHIADVFNISVENVDIFTILQNGVYLDIRFSVRDKTYYSSDYIGFKLSFSVQKIESLMNASIVMLNINECLVDKICSELSCTNNLLVNRTNFATVYTNKTSFIGVPAFVRASCSCYHSCSYSKFDDRSPSCSCSQSYFPITLEILPFDRNGLIFYSGPLYHNPKNNVKDFISLELKNGELILLIHFDGVTEKVVENQVNFFDGEFHKIHIKWNSYVTMIVDDRVLSEEIRFADSADNYTRLKLIGPLQIGGSPIDFKYLNFFFNWSHVPQTEFFFGCIKNFAFIDSVYDLGNAAYSLHEIEKCPNSFSAASVQVNSNFYVSLIFCTFILLVLLLAVVVHKKRQENWNDKDFDDIRENIINYEDEGGGEVDADFDLNVLRQDIFPEKNFIKEDVPCKVELSNLIAYLNENKDVFDHEYDYSPYDDVRYYAYEGDGNSASSLSSLASCTDEGDLKFDCLSDFGPRFRKLADMYGELGDEESSEEDEESWC